MIVKTFKKSFAKIRDLAITSFGISLVLFTILKPQSTKGELGGEEISSQDAKGMSSKSKNAPKRTQASVEPA